MLENIARQVKKEPKKELRRNLCDYVAVREKELQAIKEELPEGSNWITAKLLAEHCSSIVKTTENSRNRTWAQAEAEAEVSYSWSTF